MNYNGNKRTVLAAALVFLEFNNQGKQTPASPYTMSGLEPGVEYHLYAVVTDKAYGEATTVSAVLTATCSAGE